LPFQCIRLQVGIRQYNYLLQKHHKAYIQDNVLHEFQKYYYKDCFLHNKYNQIHNLTNITEESEVIYKHYIDSVLPYNLIKDNSKIIDLGCGGGFPSIPLKIINKSLQFTAVDSVNKKTEFVNMVKNSLNLTNFDVREFYVGIVHELKNMGL
jgi:16S rRNA (guanine(527)-N(7))-methyltransferase RsmG